MNTELTPVEQPIIPATTPVVHKEGDNVAVTALVPQDMAQCQTSLIEWCRRKVAELQTDAAELRGAFEHAKAKKWKSGTFQRHAVMAEKRVEFYQKMLIALEHGYTIVPNFPVQAFLIRTTKETPLRMLTHSQWTQDLKQKPEMLPAGEGGYENPFPIVRRGKQRDYSNPDANATQPYQVAEMWDEIDFPLSMAKPQIMEATTRAIALNLFDEIGILPAAKKEDPVIVGQLLDPRDQYKTKRVTFMIAWHLDTRTL